MRMKGAAKVTGELILVVASLVAGIGLITSTFLMSVEAEDAKLRVEQASIAYYITTSAHALSLVDEGLIEIGIEDAYDLSITKNGDSYYLKVNYNDDDKKKNDVETAFLVDVKETSITATEKICVVKKIGENIEVRTQC